MRNILIKIQYDGTQYAGWQRQKRLRRQKDPSLRKRPVITDSALLLRKVAVHIRVNQTEKLRW